MVVDGHAGGIDLSGRKAVIVSRYYDDEPGSPWDFVLHLDDDADDHQRAALEPSSPARPAARRSSSSHGLSRRAGSRLFAALRSRSTTRLAVAGSASART
jgi:hypothetical protein